MNNYLIKIENFIKNKYINTYPPELKDKIFYLLQNGKRLRPILFLLFTGEDECNVNTILNINDVNDTYIDYNSKSNIIYIVAIMIEILHSLSLVLDDLPDMDDDIMRRDNPSFHIKYGTDYTNFFIYYMFNHIGLELDNCNNFVFESKKNKINNSKKINKENIEFNIKIISDIQTIINQNINNLIDGQYDDLDWYSKNSSGSNVNIVDLNTNTILFLNEKDIIFELLNIDNELINYITTIDKIDDIELNIELNIKKTSSLFNLSITSGYILQLWKNNINYLKNDNEAFSKIYKLLSIFSNILGYMFQISDDILDIESDKSKNKPNICSILDKELVRNLLKNGCKWLYENAKIIYELMQQLLEKQDLKNPSRNFRANSLENNNDEEYIKYDSDNYSSEEGSSGDDNGGSGDDDNGCVDDDSSEEDSSEENSSEEDNDNGLKTLTFNLTVINEIIEKIENRIK